MTPEQKAVIDYHDKAMKLIIKLMKGGKNESNGNRKPDRIKIKKRGNN